MLERADHDKLRAARRLFAEGRNESVLEFCRKFGKPLPPGVTFYYVAALINLEQRALASQVISETRPNAQDRERADLTALEGVLCAYRGDADTYASKAAEASALCATEHTLYHLGMTAGSVEERLRALQASLIAAEEAEDDYAEARNANALAVANLNGGRFKTAAGWFSYALDRAKNPGLKLSVVTLQTYLQILTGSVSGLEDTLKSALVFPESPAYARQKLQTRLVLADLYQAMGRFEEALALYAQELQGIQRAMRAWLTHGYVRAQCALGNVEAAREQAEATVAVTESLSAVHQQQARLALALARWPAEEARADLLAAYRYFKERDSALATEAAFHLIADENVDERVRQELEPTLSDARIALTDVGVRFLAGQAYTRLAHLSEDLGPLKVFALGRLEVHQGGKPLVVRQRSVELLLLLALKPQGFDAEALSDALYGEFQSAGLRVELHRLRKTFGVEVTSRPYRLTSKVWSDLTELEGLLSQGRVHEAVKLYRGPLLPQSTAPAIVERRRSLEAEVQAAVVHTGDTELIWELAQIMPFDLELWEILVTRLGPKDPRYSVAAGRSARVRSELDIS